MNFWQTIFLASLQGITEFLPISSSGHLAIFQKIFNLGAPVIFDIFVHVGTVLAIVFFFRKELGKILKGLFVKERDSWRIFWLLLVGSLPALLVGLLLEKHLELIFSSLKLIALAFLLTGVLLISTKFLKAKRKKNLVSLKWLDVLIVGFFQAVAILPGVSRSGSTIVGGLWRNFKRETAFQYSFFLAIPAILGALVLQIPDLKNQTSLFLFQSILGMLVAFGVGFFSLRILKKVLLNFQFWFFGFYCFLLGFLLLIF
ncbi:undecaprenyl-diphosphate phosphatase [Patescibacteria group bacterium]|nr:undecaprenyl-diphosphate phosphatase [Patescibacteria group bacterium]